MEYDKLGGIVPPIVTPVDQNERVDEDGFRRLLRHCVNVGIHAIFVAGTNGETMALTSRERERAIRIALDEVGGEVPVICGAMDCSTRKVIENVKSIEEMGGEVAVITPPFYMKAPSDGEILAHFENVAASTNLKIMLYNIPAFTGSTISNDVLFRAAEIDNVIGYKDSSGNMAAFIKALQHFKGTGFKMFMGITDLAPLALLMGADGFVPTLAPVYYTLYLKLYNAAKAGDFQRVMELYDLVIRSNQVAGFAKNGIAANKYVVSTLGFFEGRPLAPAEEPTQEQKEKMRAFAAEIVRESNEI